MSAKEKKDKKAEKHIGQLQEQIEQLTAEKQEMFEKLQRLSADYANYQKRVPRQVADTVAYEKKKVIRSLLPSLDNFEHALAGASAAEGPEALENVIKGIQMVFDHLLAALQALGVQKAASQGQPFDPRRHEAMMQRTEPDRENGIVLEEYQPCYLLGDEVLRPAKVIVNKLPEAESPEESEPDTETETEIDSEQTERPANADADTEAQPDDPTVDTEPEEH